MQDRFQGVLPLHLDGGAGADHADDVRVDLRHRAERVDLHLRYAHVRAVKALRLAHLVKSEEIQHDVGAFRRLDSFADQGIVRLAVPLVAVAHRGDRQSLFLLDHVLDRLHFRAVDHGGACALVPGRKGEVADDRNAGPLFQGKDPVLVLEKDRALRRRFSGERMVSLDIELFTVAFRRFRRRQDRVQKFVHARIEIFHGKAAVLYCFDKLSRGAEARRGHLEIGARLYCRDMVVRAAPVGDHEFVIAPLPSKDLFEEVHALIGVFPVDLVVRSHDGAGLRLVDRHLESRQVDLAERPLVHDGVHRHAPLLLRVHGEVLDAGIDALALDALHVGSSHLTRHIGVFREVLEVAPA